MGITIGDTITLKSSLTNTNSYGSFGDSDIFIEKNGSNYIIRGQGKIWASKTARDDNKLCIDAVNIQISIPESSLSNNLYSLLYTEWKTSYTTVSNIL